MSTLTINIPEDRWAILKEISDQFGIGPEELVRISVDDLLTRPQEDCTYIDIPLPKNASNPL